jgi:hypothetical protein
VNPSARAVEVFRRVPVAVIAIEADDAADGRGAWVVGSALNGLPLEAFRTLKLNLLDN